jgi:uncharacterized protein (DUF305 family)
VLFQRFEMGEMSALLRSWEEPQSHDGLAMEWMVEGVEPHKMPGLATDEEVERLGAATGEERSALFLALMGRHHQGGVHMAEAALERVRDPFVRQLAEGMATVQRVEIREFEAARVRLGLSIPEGYTFPPTLDREAPEDHEH